MKKLLSAFIALILLSSVAVPSVALDFYKSEKFNLFPPEGFVKTEIEGTDVAFTYATDDGQTIYFLISITEAPSLSPYAAMTDYEYFNAFDKAMKKGTFISLNHYYFAKIIPIFYSIYKTDDNIRAVCAFPGYGAMMGILILSPLNHDPSPEIEMFLAKVFTNQ